MLSVVADLLCYLCRRLGVYHDLLIHAPNFHFEDKELMTLAGDVFDVPIRKDIVQSCEMAVCQASIGD